MKNLINKKVLILGSYHANNLGDQALYETYVYHLRKNLSEVSITTFSRNPKKLKASSENNADRIFNALNPFRLLFEIVRNDVFILGGGGLLFDYSVRDTLSIVRKSQIIFWCSTSYVAGLFGKKVIWSGLGVGPVNTKLAKFLLRLTTPKVDSISLRDKESQDLLNSIIDSPAKKTKTSADIVWTWHDHETIKTKSRQKEGIQIVIVPRSWGKELNKKIIKKFTKLTTEVVKNSEENIEIIIAPTNPESDREISIELKKSLDGVENVQTKVIESPSLVEFIEVVRSSDLTISMRMHAIIFSSIYGVPSIGISHKTPKIDSLCKGLIGSRAFTLVDPIMKISRWVQTFIQKRNIYEKELLSKSSELSVKAMRNVEEIKDTILEKKKKEKESPIKLILQIGLSAALFYLLAKEIPIRDTISIIKEADYMLIALATLLRILAVYPTSSVWRRSGRALGNVNDKFTLKERLEVFLIYTQAYFFDNLGVGSFGSDFYRMLQKNVSKKPIVSVGSVVLEKGFGLAFLLWIAGTLYLQRIFFGNQEDLISILLLASGVICVPVITWITLKLMQRFSQTIFKHLKFLPDQIKKGIEAVTQSNQITYLTSFNINLRVAVYYALSGLALYYSAHSVGLEITPTESIFLFSTLLLVTSLPLSFQGIGIRDATLAALLVFIGKSATPAVAISTIMLSQKLFISLVGGVIFAIRAISAGIMKNNTKSTKHVNAEG